MIGFIENVPFFLPGLAVCVVLGIILSKRLAAFLGTTRAVAFLLIVSVGTILFATLSPTTPALGIGAGSSGECDLSRLTIASRSTLLADSDVSLNIVLFVPLGFALGLLPWTRRSAVIVAMALLLTVAVESTQLLAPGLGRGCETADMVDNSLGLAIGLVAGLVARTLVAHPR